MADEDKKPRSEDLEGESTIIEPNEPETDPGNNQISNQNPATLGGNSAGPPEGDSGLVSKLKHHTHMRNKYFLIFILLLVLAGGSVLAVVFLTDDSEQQAQQAQSLTDQQLAELRGSTTIVGDSEQILDIQSDSIFQGKVLLRDSLDVAGAVKIGGPLSLPAVTVGGSTSLGQVQVNNTLSVAGTTTLQGQVNIQRNLAVVGTGSFSGTLSAGTLSATTLQLAGDLTINRHIATSGGVPGRSNGSALGSGGTASVSGTDTAGTVTIKTGSGPPAGCFVSISFRQAFSSTPHVVISPSNSSAANLNYYTNRNSSSFSICTTNTPSASANYLFDYIVFN